MATKAFLLILLLTTLTRGQDSSGLILDYDTAVTLAQLPLECYQQVPQASISTLFNFMYDKVYFVQEYPHKYGLTFSSTSELLPPSSIHPTFNGCFDWHSSVHGHWMLVALANKFPDTELEQTVIDVMDQQLTVLDIQCALERVAITVLCSIYVYRTSFCLELRYLSCIFK